MRGLELLELLSADTLSETEVNTITAEAIREARIQLLNDAGVSEVYVDAV